MEKGAEFPVVVEPGPIGTGYDRESLGRNLGDEQLEKQQIHISWE